MEECVCLSDLMKIQKKIIINHLDKHKWYNHIEDKNMATIDFIEKFGWIMREIYCETCRFKNQCKAREEIFKEIDNV